MLPKGNWVDTGGFLRYHVQDSAGHGDVADSMESQAHDRTPERIDLLPASEQRTVGHLQALRRQGLVLCDHVRDLLDIELLDWLLHVTQQRSQYRRNGRNLVQSFQPLEQSCFGGSS